MVDCELPNARWRIERGQGASGLGGDEQGDDEQGEEDVAAGGEPAGEMQSRASGYSLAAMALLFVPPFSEAGD